MSLQRVIQDIKQLSILSASSRASPAEQQQLASKWNKLVGEFIGEIDGKNSFTRETGRGRRVSPMSLSRAMQDVAKFAPRAGYPLVTAILPHILTERKQELLPALPEFGPVDLAYMSNSIANIITTCSVSDSSALLKRFGQQVGEYFSKPGRLEAVPIYSLVTLTNALNRLGYDGGVSRRRGASEDLYARFDRLCCEKIDSMNASDIAVALQSFHNGGCRHAKPSSDLLGKAAGRLKGELRQQVGVLVPIVFPVSISDTLEKPSAVAEHLRHFRLQAGPGAPASAIRRCFIYTC